MENKFYVAQNEQDWLEFRKRIIGGSEVGAILGFNSYRTALDVYYDKINPNIERVDNPKMEAGRRLEAVIADWWQDKTGWQCEPDIDEAGRQRVRIHPKYDFLGVTLDRIIIPSNGSGNGVLEIKTASEFAEKDWEEGPPLSYYAQIQHQMSVTDWKWGEFALLRGGWDFRNFHIERDDEFVELMNRELIHFWQEHVLKNIPPEPKCESEVAQLYPLSKDMKKTEANDDIYNSYLKLKRIRQDLKQLEEQDKKIVEQFKVLMGDSEALEYHGQVLATWKTSNGFNEDRFKLDNENIYYEYMMEVFDKNRFKTENKEFYNEYVEKIGSRKFVLKENKE